jgi:hypothetical protein
VLWRFVDGITRFRILPWRMTAGCQESRAFKRIELDEMNIEDFFGVFSWEDYRQNKIDGGFQARIRAPSGVWCLPNTLKWDSGTPMALNVRANPSTGDGKESLAVYPSFSTGSQLFRNQRS